jgi:CDP-paratose 2-epimerase
MNDLVLITGGAGFIGANLANRLLEDGRSVVIYDNLSGEGSERNLKWLVESHPGSPLRFISGDVRDPVRLRPALEKVGQVFHLAAQGAVTTSLSDPRSDYEINVGGVLNVLEEIRRLKRPPGLVYTSTHKVYGRLGDVKLVLKGRKYEPVNADLKKYGIGESARLNFQSPYGCSKGAADQYVLDYACGYGLRAAVFRTSGIYGPHQVGNEDQGWIAHFLLQALRDHAITIYGDGFQVRDALFVTDLVEAFLLAERKIDVIAGEAFNIGGGPDRAVSVDEVLERIEGMCGFRFSLGREGWRSGDQRYYVSDTRKFRKATGWKPKVSIPEGMERLYQWLISAYGQPVVPAPVSLVEEAATLMARFGRGMAAPVMALVPQEAADEK